MWNAIDDLDGRQRDFLEEVRVFHTTCTYRSSDDLRARLEARLQVIANEALCPWVKINQVLMRERKPAAESTQGQVEQSQRRGMIMAETMPERPRGSG